ncbi:type II membrane protein [Fusarium torreyae]|uniref:Autophagy-related protein 27 n=1 Tax=Fusarium torreyae TaxID=1237075 RepID=A0A9W8S2G8_9HYPO|nr:type II membrane protein [Fusarium torreyae]
MHRPDLLAFLLPLLAAPAFAAENLDCAKIRADGHTFDLSKLKGPHSVVTTRFTPNPEAHWNTTYTLDVCGPLSKKGGKKTEECPNGTRVCAIEHRLKSDEKEPDEITKVVAIAGNLENAGGSRFEWTPTRLSTSDSTGDKKKEGLRLVLTGGKDPLHGPSKEKKDQKAIIEFLCDPEKEGTEGEWATTEEYTKLKARADEKDGDKKEGDDKEGDDKDGNEDEGESTLEHQLKHENASLIWDGFEQEKDTGVLRLTWYTKHACEKREDNGGDDEDSTSSHWGFFTWFILIAFLGIAGYLIFSSWINFTRYGARGWDLLPHSDTIRDIPYLLKDWIRRVLNTVQGTGSRGGYSAV